MKIFTPFTPQQWAASKKPQSHQRADELECQTSPITFEILSPELHSGANVPQNRYLQMSTESE